MIKDSFKISLLSKTFKGHMLTDALSALLVNYMVYFHHTAKGKWNVWVHYANTERVVGCRLQVFEKLSLSRPVPSRPPLF